MLMIKRCVAMITVLSLVFLFAGCGSVNLPDGEGKVRIVATTTMLADLASVIGGEHVLVEGLMGPGIDPHLYQASAGDVTRMQNADIVVYTGLHLEGKMGELFEDLQNRGRNIICVTDGIDHSRLLSDEEDGTAIDPHIWFDVLLWQEAARELARGIAEVNPEHAVDYANNLQQYLEALDELHLYIQQQVERLPKEQRVLVTAHDAFGYFGQAYGFEVMGLQGISTESEAGTADVSKLARLIADRQIKAIFIESSIPAKQIEALQQAVKAQGFAVKIGGELYSDSLGDEASNTATYIQTFKANIDTIVNALQ